MRMSQRGLELLKEWEGVVLHTYKDSAGLLTVGIGHLLTAKEKDAGTITVDGKAIAYKDGITETEALSILAQDVRPAEEAVNRLVKVPLEQNQFDALVSFTFNCGVGAFGSSSLLKAINAGYLDEVPKQLRRWNKAGGKVCDGLITRRKNEIKLWLA